MQGKYKVEVVLPVTYTHTFEVEASSKQEAIEKAYDLAANFNMKDGRESHGEYDLHVVD